MRKLVNPFRKITCPYCLESFYPGECAIVTNAGITLRTIRTGFLARSFVVSLRERNYIRALAVRQCPYCKRALPYNIDPMTPTYTIAIVGNSSSGKSHYLASCIHLLMQAEAWQTIGCNRIVGQDNTDQLFYLNYYEPIFKKAQSIPPTQSIIVPEPLIYELVFPNKLVNLLFYDASGEDIANADKLTFSHYILNAFAIIFLADPRSMPCVVDALPASLQSYRSEQYSNTAILNRVISTFKQGASIAPGERLKIPIAITVSKSDLLEFVVSGTHTPLYLRDHDLSSAIDITQFEVINQEVQDFLRRCGDQSLLGTSEMFENVSFFAVSATGWPEDSNGRFPSIQPRRCLDPLLWILWKLGVINTK